MREWIAGLPKRIFTTLATALLIALVFTVKLVAICWFTLNHVRLYGLAGAWDAGVDHYGWW